MGNGIAGVDTLLDENCIRIEELEIKIVNTHSCPYDLSTSKDWMGRDYGYTPSNAEDSTGRGRVGTEIDDSR